MLTTHLRAVNAICNDLFALPDPGAALPTVRPPMTRWGRLGSNQRPRDYESPALTTELRARSGRAYEMRRRAAIPPLPAPSSVAGCLLEGPSVPVLGKSVPVGDVAGGVPRRSRSRRREDHCPRRSPREARHLGRYRPCPRGDGAGAFAPGSGPHGEHDRARRALSCISSCLPVHGGLPPPLLWLLRPFRATALEVSPRCRRAAVGTLLTHRGRSRYTYGRDVGHRAFGWSSAHRPTEGRAT